MRILSLDASTKSTGFAIFNDIKLENYGCITASSLDLINRINKIITELEQVLTKGKVEKIIMEEVLPDPALSEITLAQKKNLKTYRALMWLQAAINFLVHERFPKVEIEYVYPSEWRKACGIKTGAGIRRESLKQSDIAFVKKEYNINVNDDEADAIGIGHAYVNKLNNEINWE